MLSIPSTSVYIFLTTFFLRIRPSLSSIRLFRSTSTVLVWRSQCARVHATPQKLDISGRKKERKKRGFVTRARVVPRSVQTALENLEKEREKEDGGRRWIIERRIESWKKGKTTHLRVWVMVWRKRGCGELFSEKKKKKKVKI